MRANLEINFQESKARDTAIGGAKASGIKLSHTHFLACLPEKLRKREKTPGATHEREETPEPIDPPGSAEKMGPEEWLAWALKEFPRQRSERYKTDHIRRLHGLMQEAGNVTKVWKLGTFTRNYYRAIRTIDNLCKMHSFLALLELLRFYACAKWCKCDLRPHSFPLTSSAHEAPMSHFRPQHTASRRLNSGRKITTEEAAALNGVSEDSLQAEAHRHLIKKIGPRPRCLPSLRCATRAKPAAKDETPAEPRPAAGVSFMGPHHPALNPPNKEQYRD